MFSKLFIIALAASPLVAAHGKIAVVTGDAGGNTTALGIQGGVVPGAGTNSKTEVDTTVFQKVNPATDGLGKTKGQGANTLDGMSAVIAQSGATLPQVSSGGSLSGTLHIVTTDGAGPYTAIVDPTGTGAFSTGTKAEVTQQVPGDKGEISPDGSVRRWLVKMGLMKRAQNVNKDFPFTVAIPAGMECTGTVGGMSGVCLVKLANPSAAGPFGGVFAMQMADATASSNTTSDASTASTASSAAASTSTAAAAAAAGKKGAKKFVA